MATSTAPARLLVSIHDVAPASSSATRQWLADLDARAVPATLLVIPGPWRGSQLHDDPDLVDHLRAAEGRGHELALHGWCHQAGADGSAWRRGPARLLARGAAEFAALEQREADSRLRAGLKELGSLGIETAGFHPPGWLASPGSVAALRGLGMRYTTSHLTVHDLITGRRHRLPALSHRPGGTGEAFGARLMRGAAGAMSHTGHSFRIALHPDDLTRPGLREVTLASIDRALASGLRPSTYSDLVTGSRGTGA